MLLGCAIAKCATFLFVVSVGLLSASASLPLLRRGLFRRGGLRVGVRGGLRGGVLRRCLVGSMVILIRKVRRARRFRCLGRVFQMVWLSLVAVCVVLAVVVVLVLSLIDI